MTRGAEWQDSKRGSCTRKTRYDQAPDPLPGNTKAYRCYWCGGFHLATIDKGGGRRIKAPQFGLAHIPQDSHQVTHD